MTMRSFQAFVPVLCSRPNRFFEDKERVLVISHHQWYFSRRDYLTLLFLLLNSPVLATNYKPTNNHGLNSRSIDFAGGQGEKVK